MTRLHCNEDLGCFGLSFSEGEKFNYLYTKERFNITSRRKIPCLLLKAHTAVVKTRC